MSDIKEYVDHIIADGIITPEEHQRFTDLIHVDGEIDAAESEQLSRVFRLISEGKVKIVDAERDKVERDAVDEAKAQAIAEDEAARVIAEAQQSEINSQKSSPGTNKRKAEIEKIVAEVDKEREENRNKIAEFLQKSK
jgi:hypothetical protein